MFQGFHCWNPAQSSAAEFRQCDGFQQRDGIPADSSTIHRSRWNRWNSSLSVPASPLLESINFQHAGVPERRLLFQLTMYSSMFQQFTVEFRQLSCGSIAPACLQALQKCGSCALIELQSDCTLRTCSNRIRELNEYFDLQQTCEGAVADPV